MGERLLKWNEFHRCLRAHGIDVVAPTGGGSHFKCVGMVDGQKITFPVPYRAEVPRPYIKEVRKRFKLTKTDDVSDHQFYGD